jgi:MinD superfamily P-loop ATPase
VGCPVIASIGGANAVLIVTEPMVSGQHDMARVVNLAAHFKVPAMICVNKSAIRNPKSKIAPIRRISPSPVKTG